MKKEHIILVGDDYGAHAGWSVVCKNLIEGLSEENKNETILLLTKGRRKAKAEVLSYAILNSFRSRYKYFLIFIDLFFSILILNTKKIKVIHCLAEPYLPFCYFLSKFYGAKLITTIYGTHCILPFFSKYKNLYKKSFVGCDEISSISDYTKEKFLNCWNIKKNVEKVYIGSNEKTFCLNKKIKKKPLFIFVGSAKERKGLLPSIKAFLKFQKKFPNYKFEIITEPGLHVQKDSEYESRILQIVKENKDIIKFIGKIPEESLVRKYQECSANILISESGENVFEGFGMVHVEANLCGSLTIGGINSPNEEIIKEGKNGFLANPKSIENIIESFEKVDKKINSNDLEKINIACREEGEKFTWTNFVNWASVNYE